MVDVRRHQLALHSGQHRFTVGQRRGLGIAGAEPLYVLDKDADSNRVTVGPVRGAADRAGSDFAVSGLHGPGRGSTRVKLRYRSSRSRRGWPAAGPGRHRGLCVELEEPAYGVAPGQMACLMDGETVVGWGTITRA